MNPEQKRILIFNVNWIGDVLFSTAAIRNIRRNFSQGFIACIVPSRCYPILKGNPHLDEVIIYDDKDRHRGVLSQLKFIRYLKSKKFDAAYLLHRSFSRALICRLAGIPERVGYLTRKRAFLLTKSIIPPKKDSLHRIDYYLKIIEGAGLKAEDRYMEFFFSENDRMAAEGFLCRHRVGGKDFLAVLNPGGNWLPKRWPREYWASLADMLIERMGAKVVISGAVADAELAQAIGAGMKHKPVNACGALNIKQLGALAKRADIFVTADSGPMHIAVAVGAKRVIAIFGPTDPAVTAPFPLKNVILLRKDVGCKIPCYVKDCPDNRFMRAITPEEVFSAIKSTYEVATS